MSKSVIIAAASWEPRFLASINTLVEERESECIKLLYSEKYAAWTQDARLQVQNICATNGLEFLETQLDFEKPGELWRGIVELGLALLDQGFTRIVIDGTTMPRELTWYLLHFCAEKSLPTQYVYVPAGSYGDWLSKESLTPRLVLKRAGIVYPDKPTCVVAMSGFDIGRLNQLVAFYEPSKVEIARQIGDRYENLSRNSPGLSEYARHASIFEFDGYDLSGRSFALLKERLEPLIPEYNVLLASLGPKLGSVTAFELTEALPSVALVYIPSSSYNREYSKGADMARRVRQSVRFRHRMAFVAGQVDVSGAVIS